MKRLELEMKFAVKIGKAGERVAEKDGLNRSGKSSYVARDPSLAELSSLEFALLRSVSARQSRGSAIGIFFLNETCYGDRSATWTLDTSGKPIIIIEPGHAKLDDPLEHVLLHELAHDVMYRMGLNPDRAFEWDYAEILGWQRYFNPRTGERGWLIRSTEGEQVFYKLGKYSQIWIKCDRDGQPLMRAPMKMSVAAVPESDQVRDVAVVKPATDYFETPFEVMAEGLMLYQAGAETRKQLLSTSPRLHEIVRKFDDRGLNETLGRGVMMRRDDGVIVPNPVVVLAR